MNTLSKDDMNLFVFLFKLFTSLFTNFSIIEIDLFQRLVVNDGFDTYDDLVVDVLAV